MPRLVLVRHGKTTWSGHLRYQGHSDVPLSAEGRLQAQRLRARLQAEPIEAFHTSDLRRALQTAEIIAEGWGAAIRPIPDLRESSFGQWEGLTYREIQARFPADWEQWTLDPVSNPPTGGESVGALSARLTRAIHQILSPQPPACAAIVTHGGPIKVLVCHFLRMPLAGFWQIATLPGSVTILSLYPEGAIVEVMNDTCHLAGGWDT